MRMILIALALIAACTPAPQEAAPAAEQQSGRLEIRDAWAAPTPNGVDVAAGYLTVINGAGETDRLISAESPRAGRVEVHEMIMDGDVMRMRRAEALVIEAGQQVGLTPGGQHLMFYEVTQPFTEGQEIAVRLQFEHAGAVDVTLPVRRASAGHGGH